MSGGKLHVRVPIAGPGSRDLGAPGARQEILRRHVHDRRLRGPPSRGRARARVRDAGAVPGRGASPRWRHRRRVPHRRCALRAVRDARDHPVVRWRPDVERSDRARPARRDDTPQPRGVRASRRTVAGWSRTRRAGVRRCYPTTASGERAWRVPEPVVGDDDLFVVASGDHGRTWTAPRAVRSALHAWASPYGRIVTLADGTLVMAVYGPTVGDRAARPGTAGTFDLTSAPPRGGCCACSRHSRDFRSHLCTASRQAAVLRVPAQPGLSISPPHRLAAVLRAPAEPGLSISPPHRLAAVLRAPAQP